MVSIPEQQKHMKNFIEGKSSIVANLFEEVDEEDLSVNKVGVHNFRNKKHSILYFCKYYGQYFPLLSH
jgi:UDP-galactopyranose mutase